VRGRDLNEENYEMKRVIVHWANYFARLAEIQEQMVSKLVLTYTDFHRLKNCPMNAVFWSVKSQVIKMDLDSETLPYRKI